MAEGTNDPIDRVFRALASKPRRQILAMLASGAGEGDDRCCGPNEICACRFTEDLGLSASTVSHHMKVLADAGLVTSRKQGLWVHYRLRPEAVAAVLGEFQALLAASACCGADAERGVGRPSEAGKGCCS